MDNIKKINIIVVTGMTVIFAILIMLLSVLSSCSYKPINAYDTCKTYDGVRTAKEWKYLYSNKKKSSHLYKPFRYNTNKKKQ